MEFIQGLKPEYLAVGSIALTVVVVAGVYLIKWILGFIRDVLLPMLKEMNILRAELTQKQEEYYQRILAENSKNSTALLLRMDEQTNKLQIIDRGVQDIDDILALHEAEAKKRFEQIKGRFDTVDTSDARVWQIVEQMPNTLKQTQQLIHDSEERVIQAVGQNADRTIGVLETVREALGNTILNLTGAHNAIAETVTELKSNGNS